VSVTALGELFLPIAASDKARERERLDKEIAKIENELQTAEEKLKNKSFVERAPAAVVEEHRNRLKNLGAQLATLKQARDSFS
jgi:valyl-tRNA synthetase